MTTVKQSIIHGHIFSDPVKYGWALEKTANGNGNHWLAHDIPMGKDIEQWKNGEITPDEQFIVKRNLGFFTTADSLAANNIVLGLLRHIKATELREFLFRQAYEEGIHTEAYQYIVESLGLDEGEIFNAYNEVACIKAKDEFLLPFIDVLSNDQFFTGNDENDRALLKSIYVFAAIMEGLFFYVGFVQILALGRQNKLVGASLQYRYILRDESNHCNFGLDVFNQIKLEHPHLWTADFQQELTDLTVQGVNLEYAYAKDTMPRGVLGLSVPTFGQYLEFIADRRLAQAGLPPYYNQQVNPFPWMAEMLDLSKESNFFETRVLDYQQASALTWD